MSKKIGQDFPCRIKYFNPLPDVPFDPKLLEYPFPKDRDYAYDPANETKQNMIYESVPVDIFGVKDDLNVSTDFLGMGFFESALKHIHVRKEERPKLFEPVAKIDPKDKPLFTQPVKEDKRNTLKLRPSVPWLRRTEYISSEGSRHSKTAESGIESKMGLSIMNDERIKRLMDRSKQGQIQAIEHTFDAVADDLNIFKTLKHPTNKSLKPVEIFPIYPDWMTWPDRYTHAIFDGDPISSSHTTKSERDPLKELQAEEALLRPVANPRNPKDQYLSMFIPDETSIEKLVSKKQKKEAGDDELDDQVYLYKQVRDFDYESRLDDEKKKLFMIVRPKVAAFYHLLDSRLILKRKRAKGRSDKRYSERDPKITHIHLRRRILTEKEKEERKNVLRLVAPLDEEEEEEE